MAAMSLVESLRVLRSVRTDRQVVIPTMGSAREWMNLGMHPLDFIYAPSAMGHAPALGLGVALARPDLQVIVGNGDGCMLMNLGSLITITAAAPANLVLIVFDNGVYEVTGGQDTPAIVAQFIMNRPTDYAEIARACGFLSVFVYDQLADWQANISRVLSAIGPTFVVLKVAPVPGGAVPKSPGPPRDRARRFATTIAATP